MTDGSTSRNASRSPRSGSTSERDAARDCAPPVFIVHALSHAVCALSEAALARRAVVIASAPGAGIYAGPGWFNAVIAAARAAVPAARCSALLDCGEDAGAAQAAIRARVEGIVFAGPAELALRLAAIAGARGLRLISARPEPALDLAEHFFADDAALRTRCEEFVAAQARRLCST